MARHDRQGNRMAHLEKQIARLIEEGTAIVKDGMSRREREPFEQGLHHLNEARAAIHKSRTLPVLISGVNDK